MKRFANLPAERVPPSKRLHLRPNISSPTKGCNVTPEGTYTATRPNPPAARPNPPAASPNPPPIEGSSVPQDRQTPPASPSLPSPEFPPSRGSESSSDSERESDSDADSWSSSSSDESNWTPNATEVSPTGDGASSHQVPENSDSRFQSTASNINPPSHPPGAPISADAVDPEQQSEITSSRPQNVRNYNYITRTRAPLKGPSRHEKWLRNLRTMTIGKVKRTKCCKSRCFANVDYAFFIRRSEEVLQAPIPARRAFLRSLLDSNHDFNFNGKWVCQKFLRKAFHFGSEVMAGIANTERESGTTSKHSTNGCTSSTSGQSNTRLQKKEIILSFLRRLAEDCGDNMPDKREIHLPFHRRRDIYPLFTSQFKELYPDGRPATPQYFRTVWKKTFPHVKVLKNHRFTTCDRCDELRRNIRQAVINNISTESLKEQRSAHLEFISRERLEYQTKKDRGRLQSADYLSLIIDGADQSAFGLPHFTTKTKSQRGHALKVKLVGLLEHGLPNKLVLFTMTEEHATGANHVVEVLHRFLTSKRSLGPLPPRLFVQMDNCSRENKNKYVMGYFDMLVGLGVFKSIEVGFLPVGHTHEDVDQAFSQTSARLRVHDAITLRDLHTQLRLAFCGSTEVSHMQRVVNWSGLCENTKCLRPIDRVTQWRYFLFTRHPKCTNEILVSPLRTKCFVKRNCEDEWRDLYPSSNNSDIGSSVLRRYPHLNETPELSIKCPEGKEMVKKRLDSEYSRINCVDKYTELHDLCDFVFAKRVDPFHWDLRKSVETSLCGLYKKERSDEEVQERATVELTDQDEADQREQGHREEASDVIETVPVAEERVEGCASSTPEAESNSRSQARASPTSWNKMDYKVGSFVAVRHGSSTSMHESWIAKILDVFKPPGEKYSHKLKVRWYETDGCARSGQDRLQSKFYPCYQTNPSANRKATNSKNPSRSELHVPWIDNIDTDTVCIYFASLTKRNLLPLAVQKKLLS